MKILIWLLVAALLIAHQDWWYWNDDTLMFGFLPIGLFYHACLSLAAGAFWFLVCVFAWPKDLEEDYENKTTAGEKQ
jgi:hypothetical protein